MVAFGLLYWEPTVVDYPYVSFTNMTAFSPTDTVPYTRWAKTLMLLQSLLALVVVGLVVARAVNTLPLAPALQMITRL